MIANPLISPDRTIYVPPDDDAKAFVTYQNYTNAFLWLIENGYGDYQQQAAAITGLSGYVRSRHSTASPVEVERHLHGAWATELLMTESRRTTSEVAIRYANVWSPVQAYYAVFSASLAWLRSIGSTATSHEAALNAVTSELQRKELRISPWCAGCTGCSVLSGATYNHIPASADLRVNNLKIPRDEPTAWGLVAMSLRTSRNEVLSQHFVRWLKGQKTKGGKPRSSVPRHVKEQIGQSTPLTSWPHLLYRVRVRCNYKDIDSFAVGAWDHNDARQFYDSQLKLTSRNLFLLECFVLGVMGKTFVRTAISRFRERGAPAVARWRSVESLLR